MDAGNWITLAAVAVAIVATVPAYISLRFTRDAAAAAVAQTDLQRQIALEARRPMLWADVRPDEHRRSLLMLHLGNTGPTVARNVRAVITPPIVAGAQPFSCETGQRAAAAGIAALPPGRTLSWTLGTGVELLEAPGQPSSFTMTVTGDAPDGIPLEEMFTFRLDDLRNTDATEAPPQAAVQQLKHLVTEVRAIARRAPGG